VLMKASIIAQEGSFKPNNTIKFEASKPGITVTPKHKTLKSNIADAINLVAKSKDIKKVNEGS
jgi:hypothetical protein